MFAHLSPPLLLLLSVFLTFSKKGHITSKWIFWCGDAHLSHTPMHTCAYTLTKSACTHTLACLWTLLYEAENYPTIGNHNLPYLGLIQIHLGPFSLIMCIQWSNIEATARCLTSGNIQWPNALFSLLTLSHFFVVDMSCMGWTVQLWHIFLIFLCVYTKG